MLFFAAAFFGAARDAISYYQRLQQMQRSNASRVLDGPLMLAPMRRDRLEFPDYVSGLETFIATYSIASTGLNVGPNEYVHIDVTATKGDFDIQPVSSDDISTARGGQSSFLITPKKDGFAYLNIRASQYNKDPRTGRRSKMVDIGTGGLRQIAIDEPMFTVPWFEAHGFAKDFLFAILPLAIGFVAGAAVGKESTR